MKPDVPRLKALIDAGRLGTPILASASVRWHRPPEYYQASAWRGTRALDGGGALMNQGVHTVDLLLWLFGPGPPRVRQDRDAPACDRGGGHGGGDARVRERRDRHDRSGDVGVPGIRAADRADRIGRDREARRRPARGDRSATARSTATWRPDANPVSVAASSPVVTDVSAHRAVLEDFIAAIARGVPPCCDGAQGRASVAVIEAIYRSSTRPAGRSVAQIGLG